MDWRPRAPRSILELRAALRREVRDFFAARDVLEIDAPVLVSASSPDPNVPGIAVYPHGDARPRFLHTSPEHAMKRLLCAGSGDIYFCGPVFRDGELGRWHNPEFTMIEWYRLGLDHIALAEETVALLRRLLGAAGDGMPLVERSYTALFAEHTGLDVNSASACELAGAGERLGIALPATATRTELVELLFACAVTPAFEKAITVVTDYPPEQAALARLSTTQPRVAERFEVFVGSIELANGFHELADVDEQRRRFARERERYLASGRPTPEIDERLLAALGHGLPDCAGVALGFDRAVMLAAERETLADVIAFPYGRC